MENQKLNQIENKSHSREYSYSKYGWAINEMQKKRFNYSHFLSKSHIKPNKKDRRSEAQENDLIDNPMTSIKIHKLHVIRLTSHCIHFI